jgi:hypothetical protein
LPFFEEGICGSRLPASVDGEAAINVTSTIVPPRHALRDALPPL